MNKTFVMMLMLSLVTVSCGGSGGGSSSGDQSTQPITETTGNNSNTNTPSPGVTAPNVPTQALSFSTNVKYLEGFAASDEDKYDQAVSIVKKVVATEAFRTKVLNHMWNGSKKFADNNGLTNAQIYQSILDAAEKLSPKKNNTMDVGVKLYYNSNNVVGYTNPSITYINVNTKYFDSYDANEVAGNLFHEWLHKVGYGHDSSVTAKRPYSVPYAVGYMIRDLGKKFL